MPFGVKVTEIEKGVRILLYVWLEAVRLVC